MTEQEYHQQSSCYTTFKVSLTKDQQKSLTKFLPKGYSFQPFKSTRSLDEESLLSEPKMTKSNTPNIQKKQAV
jgi:hypothetical protein